MMTHPNAAQVLLDSSQIGDAGAAELATALAADRTLNRVRCMHQERML